MKKTLAIMLALIMVLALVPSVAFAEEPYVAWIDGKGYATLEAAVNAATDGAVIMLGEGDFSTYGNNTPKKSLTFVGAESGKTNWYIGSPTPDKQKEGTEYNGDYSFQGCESIPFKNIKFSVYPSNYKGFIRINNVEVDGCEIKGMSTYWGYKKTIFKNTVFTCPDGDYALWYYTGTEMSFDKCTFNASGKVVHAYREGTGNTAENPLVLNFKDCKVVSSGAGKSVLNIKDQNHYYTVNISGINTVEGLTPNTITCSRLFQVAGWADNYNLSGGKGSEVNGNGNNGKTTVNIDNTPVWKNGKMVGHKYTDGYKDNKFEIIKDTTTGGYVKKCIYCGYTEPFYGELSNEIGLKRTVKQGQEQGQEVKIETNNPKDTYKVNGPSDITVDYTATMDMTKLKWEKPGSLSAKIPDPWQMLATQPDRITEDTVVFLKFTFDKNIDLEAFKATYEAAVNAGKPTDVLMLESNMFEIADDGVQFDIENQIENQKREMTIKCNWKKETGHDPDPIITLYGFGLPVEANWGGNKIEITNSGCVSGMVHIKKPRPEAAVAMAEIGPNVAVNQVPSTYPPVIPPTIQIPIVGGCKTDEFTLYYGGGSSGGNGGGGHYYPDPTPVPVIVIPPKTGDMTVWQSILHFLGIK